jgi:hypothetical protein
MKKLSLHAIRSATEIIQIRRDIEHNPHNYLSDSPDGVQASASQSPDPHRKASLIFIFQAECCVCLHPLGGAKVQHNILFYSVPVVFTLSTVFFFIFCPQVSRRYYRQ